MNPRQRIKALETVPRTLSAAYNEIITRIEASGNAGDAMQIMSWLMYAQEPLTMNALLEALVTEEGDIELQRDYMLNPTDVVECCKSLVVHDTSSDIVRFTHYTVQEFIVTLKSHLLDGGTLAKTCLDYLALDVFKAPIGASWNCESYFYDRVQRYKFSLYAARHWGVHAAGDPENSADVQRAIIRVLQSQQKRNAVAQLASRDCRFYSQNQTLLHFVAHYGHATICSLLLRKRLLPDTYMCSADNDVAMPSLEDDISRMDEDMRTPLHYAALKGHTQVVRILLSGGASIHAQDAYGWTALHAAANNGHADVVKVLVQADADPTIPDKKGQTPLHLSASNGHANATLSLLQGQGDVEARNLDGRTALHLAVGIGDIEVVKILLEWNSDVLAKDFDKRTPLHHAARYGRFEVIKWLLTYSRNFTNYIQDQDKDDRTALHHAAWNCDVEVVRLLLDANPNVIEVCDVYGRTALHQAAANGGLKVVKMLVNGNIDATDWRGRTALILAAERGDVAVVEALLEANADPTISDVEALTPLECAAIGGHNEIIKALAAVKVDSWALQGSQRVLQWTVESGHVETVKLLLDLLADAIGTESRDSALEIARWNEFEEIVTLLENAQLPGAPPSRFATKTGELAMSNDRKLTIHTPSRVDHDGRFHSMEIYPGFRCPPRCSREILFASPYPAPPSLVVGLNEIATSRRDNIRIKTYADEVHCDRFRIHIDSWARSKFFSAGSTWFTVGEGDQEYQYGSFNTLEDHPWDEPQIRTSRSIRFVRPYDVAPVVVVWLNSLDLYRQNEWRLRASASDISSTGFTLHIDSFGDTILFGAGASWIAYPIGKAGVASGTCRTDSKLPPRTNEQEATGYDGEAKFMTNFNTIPRVFVAFNMLSVSWREFLKVNVAIESINEVGMIWRINAWDGTRLDAAEASYIAIG